MVHNIRLANTVLGPTKNLEGCELLEELGLG